MKLCLIALYCSYIEAVFDICLLCLVMIKPTRLTKCYKIKAFWGPKSEWADYAAVQVECGNLSRNELTRNLSGNSQSQSSQLTEPLWTNPGLAKDWN